ncbi:MAG: PilZ domain-containing protein [Candidatus Ratteibacteria bacterium]|nr:PilZ domain-containing protein [Candidatus Ratteibacteria bacterium]
MVFGAKYWKKHERRRHPRVNVLFPVQYVVIPKVLKDIDVEPASLGICRNISGGGILLEVAQLKEEMLLCDNLLKLEVKLPDENNPIYIFSRLIKAEKSLTEDSYYLRLCFVNIDEGTREKIMGFTDKCRSKKARG